MAASGRRLGGPRPPEMCRQQIVGCPMQRGRSGLPVRVHAKFLQDPAGCSHPRSSTPAPATPRTHSLELRVYRRPGCRRRLVAADPIEASNPSRRAGPRSSTVASASPPPCSLCGAPGRERRRLLMVFFAHDRRCDTAGFVELGSDGRCQDVGPTTTDRQGVPDVPIMGRGAFGGRGAWADSGSARCPRRRRDHGRTFAATLIRYEATGVLNDGVVTTPNG